MDLKLDINRQDQDILVKMGGDLDISSSKEFTSKIEKEYEKYPANLVFHMEDLDYIDSTGLGSFMTFYRKLKDTDHSIRIKGAKENILKIFKITELDKVFGME